MHIKSIVIDGFKSYGSRTEINGFDKEFNAITGLNGTGKSNILDSICFVLGISNLSQVRANSLQDLIYRSGQAGVVKATVSVTFDNTNAHHSPPGFEDFKEITVTRQVIMGGKSKYLVNGSVVPNKRVQDLFCSIQLNVNNPHFLIMQGRITKVLNMKPPEILSMVEEAAGTRMYETKRQVALKTIEKKDSKLMELDQIIKEEIGPKLDKLREERAAYFEFQRIEREIEHMMSLYQAWLYLNSKSHSEKAKKALEEGEARIQAIRDNIQANKTQAKNIDKKVEEMSRTVETDSGGKLQAVEAELKETQKEEAKALAAEKAAKDNISAEEKAKKQLEKNLKDDKAALKSKETELEKVQGLFQQLKDADAADNEAFAIAQKKFEAISIGMEVNDAGETETLQEQLMSAKQQATEANTEIKQANMQLTHLQTQLKEKQKDLGANTSDHKTDQANMESLEREVKALEKNLSKLNYSDDRMVELKDRRRALTNEIRTLRERNERFQAQYQYTNFQYRDPETNFNRRSVKGVVCRLFTLQDREASVALETAAGGKLYNVVVDTDMTSKKLLQRGNLQNRTTFIPLNKIQAGKIDSRVVKIAQDLVGKENVQPALSLINYDPQLQPAMEFVFGNVFICRDLNVARQVTFNDRIRCKCVTLEGDVTDPAGTLSGGARQKGTSVLIQLEDVKALEAQLHELEQQLVQTENEIHKMSGAQEQWDSLKQRLELQQHELGLVRQRLQQTTHHQQRQEINNIKESIGELTTKIQSFNEIETKNKAKAKDLEEKMKDTKGHRERLLKSAEEEMKNCKKRADNSRKNWKKREQEYETLNLEINELKKTIEAGIQHIVESEEKLEKVKQRAVEVTESASGIKALVEQMKQKYQSEKGAIMEKNKEIHKEVEKKEQLLAQISELELEIKKKNHEVKMLQDEFKQSKTKAEELKKAAQKNKSLKDAEALSEREAKDLEKRIRFSQEKRTKLSRTVNTKAQSMFDVEEKQYQQILKKKGIVESDKKKLLAVMKDLDKKKQEALLVAYEQVSKDFGSIFSTLLPGTNAKLQPPSGQTALQGLEVKVFLGGVWKQSLDELSGGQRSLAALSLILAMLLFKPAPLYILDEVDAALDLSHTQNIGSMLKSHFKQSQFIVVSLKDGMFNNANVLYRTRFVDGVSVVTRTVNRAA